MDTAGDADTAPTRNGTDSGSADAHLALALEGTKDILKQQDATLGSLRTRCTTLLSTAALIASFAAAVGLLNNDPSRGAVLPDEAAWALFALLTVNGACALHVFWPARRWTYSAASPVEVFKQYDAAKTVNFTWRSVTDELVVGALKNREYLGSRVTAFRWQVASLILEVLVLLAALTLA